MATVFISHSSKDDGFANDLSQDLRLIGYTPWIDQMDVLPGESIISSIEKGLSKANVVLVVLSEQSMSSGWVETEWKEKFWETITSQKIRVIPVLKERVTLPLFLRTLRYADFTASYAVGFAVLCLTLRPLRSQVPPDVLDRDFLHAIEYAARTSHDDHIRLACAHTIWSFRPDRAKPILEDALNDMRDVVRIHAKVLLDQFY